MIAKLIAIALSLLILAQAYAVRRVVGTWLFPACLYGLFWFALSFLPLVALLTVPVDPVGVAFLLLSALAFSSGALLFDWRRAFARNALKDDPRPLLGGRFLAHAFGASTAGALVLVVANTLNQGFGWADIAFNLFATAELYATLRYADQLTAPLVERWSVVLMYVGALLGGLRYGTATARGRRLILLAAFVPSVLVAVTQSAKWPFLLSIALFLGGTLVHRAWTGRLALVGAGNRRAIVSYGVLAVAVVGLSFASRGLYEADSFEVLPMVMSKVATYTSGHLYAFCDWFAWSLGRPAEWSYVREPASYGFYTFATIFNVFGSDRVLPIGVYDDDYAHGAVLLTNVFTMFRGMVHDFGVVGTLALMAGLGTAFHGAFYAFLVARRPVFGIVAFLFMTAFIFSSFVASALGQNIALYVTFAILWMLLWVNANGVGFSVGDAFAAQRLSHGAPEDPQVQPE